MKRIIVPLVSLLMFVAVASCTNAPSDDTGEIVQIIPAIVESTPLPSSEVQSSAAVEAGATATELPAVVIVSDSGGESEPVVEAEIEPAVEADSAQIDQADKRLNPIPAGTKFGRFQYQDEIIYGIVLENGLVERIEGDLFNDIILTEEVIPLEQLKVLAPVLPSKIIAIGLNYRSHAGESGAGAPGLFSKFPTSLAGPGDPIWLFPESDNTHYEGELVIVIGKRAYNIAEADASQYIFGVTAGNDITERTWQQTDLQWIRAKASDSFAPIGPYIVTGLNYNDLLVQTRVNGVTTQSESTASLIHSVDKIVSYTSRYITLEPGDIIYTGTPGSTSAMSAGDVIEVEVEGVGVLRNTAEPWDPDS